jgi:hypothetical protein
MINTILRNTFKKEFLETNLPHINLLTLEVKDVVTYLKQSGLVHHLKSTVHQQCESRWYSRIDMYESFYANYEDIENILIERREEDRMAHVQHETLQMLLSFLTPFKEASLQLEADTHATLPLVLPIRFNLLDHLNMLVSDTHELAELKKHARIIINEKFTTHKLHRVAMFLWSNFRQLRMLSTEEQEETKGDVRNLIDEFKRDEELGSTAVISGNLCEECVSDNYQHISKKPKILDFRVFEDAVEVSESQEDEIEKYMHIEAGHVKLNDLLDWWKNQEKEFKHLSRIARHVLSVPATSASSRACRAGASNQLKQ